MSNVIRLKPTPALLIIIALLTCHTEVLLAQGNKSEPPETTTSLKELFRSSYELYAFARNSKGIYRDKVKFEGEQDAIASTAAIGIGLISLCIADAMSWTTDAEDQVETTLKSVLGITPGITPDTNEAGFYQHWVTMDDLQKAEGWPVDYSTIDTAILVAGALFAKTHFKSPGISILADQLWQSIDWSVVLANPSTGALFLQLNEDGTGIPSLTMPYSEYLIVAWLAKLAEQNNPGAATTSWENAYANPHTLPTSDFQEFSLLTDDPPHFQSHFTLQFAYFLSHYFSSSTGYIEFFREAALADMRWWQDTNSTAAAYEWGLCAGEVPADGYSADAIHRNDKQIVSPHCIAGFLPVYPEAQAHLTQLLEEQERAVFILPNTRRDTLLWRYSLVDTTSTPAYIQLIDYASMLFGLASLPEHLGPAFFTTRNNFDLNLWPKSKKPLSNVKSLRVGGEDYVLDLRDFFTDEDPDNLVFSVESRDSEIAIVQVLDHRLEMKPVNSGSTTIQITAKDSLGAFAVDSLTVSVQE
ncbi:MAG: hypothetical protein AB8G77_01435 [Rhodothermales bacterium]